jgi:hypothetical protein
LATAAVDLAGNMVSVELAVKPAGHELPQVAIVTAHGRRGLVVQQDGETVAQLLVRAARIAADV